MHHPPYTQGTFKGDKFVVCSLDGANVTSTWALVKQHTKVGRHKTALRVWESTLPGADADDGVPRDLYGEMAAVAALAEVHNISSRKLIDAMREDKDFRDAVQNLDFFPHHKVVTDAVVDTAEKVMELFAEELHDAPGPIGGGSDESYILNGKVSVLHGFVMMFCFLMCCSRLNSFVACTVQNHNNACDTYCMTLYIFRGAPIFWFDRRPLPEINVGSCWQKLRLRSKLLLRMLQRKQ